MALGPYTIPEEASRLGCPCRKLCRLSVLLVNWWPVSPQAKLAVAGDWWALKESCLPGQALGITEVRETLPAKPEAVSRME